MKFIQQIRQSSPNQISLPFSKPHPTARISNKSLHSNKPPPWYVMTLAFSKSSSALESYKRESSHISQQKIIYSQFILCKLYACNFHYFFRPFYAGLNLTPALITPGKKFGPTPLWATIYTIKNCMILKSDKA